jgi:molybdate transport system substrate-binding protein
MSPVTRLVLLAALAAGLAAGTGTGCDEPPREAPAPSPPLPASAPVPSGEREVVVFAAASLREAFEGLATSFEAAHPGVEVTLQLAGTQELRAQIEAGAPADVLASADVRSMEALRASGRVAESFVFARSEPVLVVARDAAERVPTFEALPAAERIVLGVPEVPIGRYAIEILGRASASAPGFRERVEARVVSRELNVRQVLAKVAMGEADAGIVYRTDARAAEGVVVRDIPPEVNVVAEYPIATLVGAAHPHLARELVAFARGAEGRRALAEAGFLAPASEAP